MVGGRGHGTREWLSWGLRGMAARGRGWRWFRGASVRGLQMPGARDQGLSTAGCTPAGSTRPRAVGMGQRGPPQDVEGVEGMSGEGEVCAEG